MVPDKQVVAFYFRVRQQLLSVAVVEFVESELVSVGYFDLFLSKNIVCFGESIFSRVFFVDFNQMFTLTFPAFSETVASETSLRSSG